jgi:hypothetical protein
MFARPRRPGKSRTKPPPPAPAPPDPPAKPLNIGDLMRPAGLDVGCTLYDSPEVPGGSRHHELPGGVWGDETKAGLRMAQRKTRRG